MRRHDRYPFVDKIHRNCSILQAMGFGYWPLIPSIHDRGVPVSDRILEQCDQGVLKNILELMIETAIFIRMYHDFSRVTGAARNECWERAVGELELEKQSKQLKLRDACNKIIHQEGWRMDGSGLSKGLGGLPIANSILLVIGRTSGKDSYEWRAKIDMFLFCAAAAEIT